MSPNMQIIIGFLIAAGGACASIYGGYLVKLGFDGRPPLVASRGPTLEATHHSVVDASGGSIPGDLPFQFGHADDHSLLAIPGIKVTKNGEESYTVIPPAQVNLVFPQADGKFSTFSNSDLKKNAKLISDQFRAAHNEFMAKYQSTKLDHNGQMSEDDWKAFADPLDEKFRNDLIPLGVSIVSELIRRINGNISLPDQNAQMGARELYYRQVASAGHADNIADFIDLLAQSIRDD